MWKKDHKKAKHESKKPHMVSEYMKYRKDLPTTFNFFHLERTNPNISSLKKTQTNKTNKSKHKNLPPTVYKPKPQQLQFLLQCSS